MNLKWDLDEAEGILWPWIEADYSFVEGMKKIYGFSFTRNIIVMGNDHILKWRNLTKALLDIGQKCVKKFMDKNFRNQIMNDLKEVENKCNVGIKKYISCSGLSLKELLTYLEKLTMCYREVFEYGAIVEPFNEVFHDIFVNALKKYNMSTEEIADLSTIPKLSYMSLENMELMKLALNDDSKLDKHLLKYEWILTGHAGKKKIGLDYFKNRINELKNKDITKEINSIKNFESNVKQRKKKLIEKYSLDEKALELIKIIDEIGPLHDKRKELFAKLIYYCDDIREKVGELLGYTLDDLQYFELKELLPFKEGKILDKEEIRRRKEFVFYDVDYNKKSFKLYASDEAKKKVKIEFPEEMNSVTVLKGTIANKDKVTGVVKKIFKVEEFQKMNKGDILVSGMTRPEMTPIIKKAAAIVTDEGGITCHAAIVSRELGIPCIIGTKIATKVFKDGDLVEVDADKGIVRKLK